MAEYSGQRFGWFRNPLALIFIPIAALLARVAVGQGFFIHGHTKVEDVSKVQTYFENLGIPNAEYLAPFVSYAEWIGGILLVLGLGTRLVALVLSGILCVAVYQEHWGQVTDAFGAVYPAADAALISITPIPFLIGTLWLVGRGPGAISLDALFMAFLGRRDEDDWEE